MAKIYRVIQTKLNQLVYENVRMITLTNTAYLNAFTVIKIYLQDGGKNQLV